MKSDYDPEIGKRQTAANCAASVCAKFLENLPDADKLDAFSLHFPVVADIVLKFVDSKGSVAGVAGAGSDEPADEFENTF